MIITRTSRPFGRPAPQFTAGDVVKGIARLVRSETAKTFSFGYGTRRQLCSGISVVQANDGTDCGTGQGQPVCVARTDGRTFEIPCQLGSGGSGGGLTTSLGRRSFYSGKVLVFRDSACANVRVYSMAGVYLGSWRYLTGGPYTCQTEDRTNEAWWARISDSSGDPPVWFPKTGDTPHPGEIDETYGVSRAQLDGLQFYQIQPATVAGQHREASYLGWATGYVAAIARRAGIETMYDIDVGPGGLATQVRPDLRDPVISPESALGHYGPPFGPYSDADYVMAVRDTGIGETFPDSAASAVLPAGVTDLNGDIVADPDGTIWVHAINPSAARVTLYQYDMTGMGPPVMEVVATVAVSLGAGMFLDSIQVL